MADPAVAAAMAAARALLSPGDPATLVAADAHLRAVNDSPDGWRIGRALCPRRLRATSSPRGCA